MDDAAQGINWATNNGAKVINMSFGFSTGSKTLLLAVNNAWVRGVVLVASAGNSGVSSVRYPAWYGNVIAVGATDNSDRKASYSNYGSWVDVAAPGSRILSTINMVDDPSTTKVDESYATKSGTSMATPHVAGVAGLVWSKPGLCASNACVRTQIVSSIEDRTVLYGTGPDWSKARVNACIAVTACKKPPVGPIPPVASGSN